MINDLVTRVDYRAKGDIHGFAHPHRNKNLVLRIVGDLKTLLQAG